MRPLWNVSLMLMLNSPLLNREYNLINVLKTLVATVSESSLHVIFLPKITSRYFTLLGLMSYDAFQSESQSCITTDSQSASLSWCQAPIWDPQPIFPSFSLINFRQLGVCWCGAPSLTRSRVCSFQFLLGIASAAFLRSESHEIREHILLSLFLRLPQHAGPGSCTYFALEKGSPVIRALEVEVEVNLRPTVSRPARLGVRRPSGTRDQFFFLLEISFRQLRLCYFVAPSLMWGRICNLLYNCFWAFPEQSLLGRSPAKFTALFYCLIWDTLNLEGQVPVFISPRNRVAELDPRALGSLFFASYDSQGLRWRYSNPPPHRVPGIGFITRAR
jgi:hypothetical protein